MGIGQKKMEKNISLRKASEKDIDLILSFIKGIAEYEKLLNEVKATPENIYEWLFERKIAEVMFVLQNDKEVGFVLYFYNFSTFVGKAGIYIEDLYVKPEYRSTGCGKALMHYIINKAKTEKLGRVEWTCLDWNTNSIEFYKSLGAKQMSDWTNFRLTIAD